MSSLTNTQTTWYPQSALVGFAQAVEYKFNLKIDFTTGQPRTNGKTVYLPQIKGVLTETGFKGLCGIALHECAHVYWGTAQRMKKYVHANGGQDQQLRAACYNGVVDVADETRMEACMPYAKSLFLTSNINAMNDIVAKGSLKPGGADEVWQIIAAGILGTRLGSKYGQPMLTVMTQTHPLIKTVIAANQILIKARYAKGKKPLARRSQKQWQSLADIADELVALLKAAGHGKGSGTGPDGGDPTNGSGNGGAIGPVASDASDEADSGVPAAPAGDKTADQATGAGMADAPDPGDEPAPPAPPSHGSGNGAPGGSGAGDGTSKTTYVPGTHIRIDTGLVQELSASINGAIDRIAEVDDADGAADGYYSGTGITRNLERIMLDGRGFTRRVGEGERLNACVLLDSSGSMETLLGKASAVAEAFSNGLARVCDNVFRAHFNDDVYELDTFSKTKCDGCTGTHRALEWVDKKLAGLDGRRVCVIITDGAPDSVDRTQQSTQLLLSHGIHIIGIAYCTGAGPISNSMPGSHVVEAHNPNELAGCLTQIAQQIAHSRV